MKVTHEKNKIGTTLSEYNWNCDCKQRLPANMNGARLVCMRLRPFAFEVSSMFIEVSNKIAPTLGIPTSAKI